jgi:hypothetical protein
MSSFDFISNCCSCAIRASPLMIRTKLFSSSIYVHLVIDCAKGDREQTRSLFLYLSTMALDLWTNFSFSSCKLMISARRLVTTPESSTAFLGGLGGSGGIAFAAATSCWSFSHSRVRSFTFFPFSSAMVRASLAAASRASRSFSSANCCCCLRAASAECTEFFSRPKLSAKSRLLARNSEH